VTNMKKLSLLFLLLLINSNYSLALRPTANLSDERVLTSTDRRGFSFESISARDEFFGVSSNSVVLKTGIPVDVNEGTAVTTFVWLGDDEPVNYDPALFAEKALNSGPGTLFLGLDGVSLSSAAKSLNFNSAFGDKAIPLGQAFTDDGSTGPTHFRFTKINDFIAADIFDTQLGSPNQWIFENTIFNSYTEGITIRAATSGTLVLKAYAGNADTFPIVIDTTFEILPGDIGNLRSIPFPNGLLAVAGDEQLIVASGIDLFGGLQTDVTLPFFNQTVGYLQSDTFVLTLSDLITRNQFDDYALLNSQYNTAAEKSGGLTVITLPTATVDTVSAAEFIAGIDSTSNPTVTTVGSAAFSQNDIIQYLSDPGQPNANDGIYEVHSHIGNALQVRGGLNPTVEDDTQDQFVNLISSGTFTKVGVSVLKATSTGFEIGFGNTTPITFTSLGLGGSNTQVQYNNNGSFGGISGITTDGTNLDVSGRIDGAGAGGALIMRGADNSPVGGPIEFRGGGASVTGGKLLFTPGFGGTNGGDFEFMGVEGPNGRGSSFLFDAGDGGPEDGSGDGGGFTFNGGQGGFDSGDGGGFDFTTGVGQGFTAASGSFIIDIGDSVGGGPIGSILLAPTRGNVVVGSALITNGNVQHKGIYHEIDAVTININNGHILSNAGFSDQIARTANRIDVYLGDSATSAASDFDAGVLATAPPLITIADLNTFVANDLILVTGTAANNGLYEVQVQLGFVIFCRGIGATEANVEDFTRDQVVTSTEAGTVRKVNVSVHRTSLTGTTEHGEGNQTPITFFKLAHADDVPIVATEEFAATEATFNAELGLPSAQGFTDTEINTGTITLISDTVFSVQKNVIKYTILASGDTTKSEIPVTAANWISNLTNGFSFRGEGCRITEDISTQSIFSGTGFSAANDPRPTSIQSRVGIFISEDGTNTTITLDGQSTVILDGTAGKPLVPKDTYFNWEVFVDETPDAGVSFGAATLTVNGVQVKVGGIVTSNSAVSDEVSVANSSSTGTTTFYFVGFGVTMYEEGAVKTLSIGTMTADIIQVKRPKGDRDHTVILPDGNPRKLGNRLEFVGGSAGTKLKIKTANTAAPQSLFNGLNEIELNIVSTETIGFVNIVEGGNVYIGNVEILNQDPLGFDPGSVNYDPVKGTMNVRNIFPGSSVQVGQESVVFVVNNTVGTIVDGKVVNISGYDAANDAMEIQLALADKVKDTSILGMTTTEMIDGAVGLVTIFGRVNDLDTTSFTGGDVVYLSDTVAGDLTATRPAIPIQIGHVGKIDASTGFIQVQIRELQKSIFGSYVHTLDQTFTANVSKPIAFNKNKEFSGITHSETVNNAEFTFPSPGVYQATAEPQYTRTTGGGTDVLNMFVAKDTGSGFNNEDDSNVKFTVVTTGATNVSPLTATFRVLSTDKIQFMINSETANLILDAFPASGTAPNDIPLTPSIIMNLVRIGD